MNAFIADNRTDRMARELPAGAGVGQVQVAIAELLSTEERRFDAMTIELDATQATVIPLHEAIEIVTARRIVEASCSLLDATRIGGGRVIARYYLAPPRFGGEQ